MQSPPSISPSSKRPNSSGRTIELGGLVTALVSALIVLLGFALSRVCIYFFLQPECALKIPVSTTGIEFTESLKQHSIVKSELVLGARTTSIAANETKAAVANQPSVEEFPTTANFPPQCTPHQRLELQRQLPPERCKAYAKTPWKKKAGCSFSNSTKCGNSNPHWLYEHFDNKKDFTGVLVGCNKGFQAVELLRRLSSSKKYRVQEWIEEFGKTDDKIDSTWECGIPMNDIPLENTVENKQIKLYCIDGAPNTIDRLQTTKTTLGYGDDLDIVHTIIGEKHVEDGLSVKTTDPIGFQGSGHVHWANECKKKPKECEVAPATSIDAFIDSKENLKATNTLIDYMSINAEGSDYQILKGAARNLHRIQYIDFYYHWHGLWEKQDLQDLIYRLKKQGFVCYFTTNGRKLWRITDCWQDHYSIKFKASVGCVNANISASEPLLNTMEGIFRKTLENTTL